MLPESPYKFILDILFCTDPKVGKNSQNQEEYDFTFATNFTLFSDQGTLKIMEEIVFEKYEMISHCGFNLYFFDN